MHQPASPSASLIVVITIAAMFVWTDVATAQSNAHIAVGADLTKALYRDDGFERRLHPSLLYRVRKHRQPSNGWRFRAPQFGFNWGGTDVTQAIGGANASFGRVTVIGLLGGVAETLVFNEGINELSFSVLAGPGISRFHLSGNASEAYRAQFAGPVTVDVKNTFIVRPGVSFWHDLSSRLGFHSSISYVVARPAVTTRTPSGEIRTRWHMDHIALKAGLAVGIF